VLSFLKDDKGNFSMMRLTMFISLIVAIVVTFTTKDVEMVGLWLGVATLGKVGQKAFEK